VTEMSIIYAHINKYEIGAHSAVSAIGKCSVLDRIIAFLLS